MLDCQDTINSISVGFVIVYGKRADLAIRSKTNVHFNVSFLTTKVVITTHQNSSFLQIYQNAACITCESYCVPRAVFRLTEERTLYAFSTHP